MNNEKRSLKKLQGEPETIHTFPRDYAYVRYWTQGRMQKIQE
jgi:hypothetical protein